MHARADAAKDHMGLTSWAGQPEGGPPRKADVAIAKNYLEGGELEPLNRIVTAYLEFAELACSCSAASDPLISASERPRDGSALIAS